MKALHRSIRTTTNIFTVFTDFLSPFSDCFEEAEQELGGKKGQAILRRSRPASISALISLPAFGAIGAENGIEARWELTVTERRRRLFEWVPGR